MTAGPRPAVRDDLADLRPYGAPQLDVEVRLNTNETPWAPPAEFTRALADAVAGGLDLHRYPDRDAVALRTALADREGLDVARVWAANGSNEVLAQLFAAYGGAGREVLLFQPGYSAHPLLARVTGTRVVHHDLDDALRLTPAVVDAALAAVQPAIICVASPNNPTGIPVAPDVVRRLHDGFAGLLVLDEAYVELAPDPGEGRALLDELDRLVVVRTYSKAWRMAGLRLGYLLGHDWVVEDLLKVRLPYHLDTLTQVAGTIAVGMAGAVTSHIADLVAERERLLTALDALEGVEVWPSAGNFLLLRVPPAGPDGHRTGEEATAVFAALLADGVLVRDFSSLPRLDGCLRVTVGTPEENDRFMFALTTALHGHAAPVAPADADVRAGS